MGPELLRRARDAWRGWRTFRSTGNSIEDSWTMVKVEWSDYPTSSGRDAR